MRLHDASLYRGKYYLYFGVVPALAPLPAAAPGRPRRPPREPGGGHLRDRPASSPGCSCCGTSSAPTSPVRRAGAGRRLRHRRPRQRRALRAARGLGLRGRHHRRLRLPRGRDLVLRHRRPGWAPVPARLALGGLLLGLAVGCRPNHILLVPLLPLLAWPAVRGPGTRARAAVAVLVPLGACLLLLGAYNQARFDRWLEFGTRFTLAGAPRPAWLDPRAIPAIVWFHFLAPPTVTRDFPFFLPRTDYPGQTPEGFYAEPSVTGAFAHAPFLLILLVAAPLLRDRRSPAPDDLRWCVLVLDGRRAREPAPHRVRLLGRRHALPGGLRPVPGRARAPALAARGGTRDGQEASRALRPRPRRDRVVLGARGDPEPLRQLGHAATAEPRPVASPRARGRAAASRPRPASRPRRATGRAPEGRVPRARRGRGGASPELGPGRRLRHALGEAARPRPASPSRCRRRPAARPPPPDCASRPGDSTTSRSISTAWVGASGPG